MEPSVVLPRPSLERLPSWVYYSTIQAWVTVDQLRACCWLSESGLQGESKSQPAYFMWGRLLKSPTPTYFSKSNLRWREDAGAHLATDRERTGGFGRAVSITSVSKTCVMLLTQRGEVIVRIMLARPLISVP
jgi:hypothetical protein